MRKSYSNPILRITYLQVYLMGGLISFASKNLKVVALSSAEAEYAAASYTCKELTFVRNILNDLTTCMSSVLGVERTALRNPIDSIKE